MRSRILIKSKVHPLCRNFGVWRQRSQSPREFERSTAYWGEPISLEKIIPERHSISGSLARSLVRWRREQRIVENEWWEKVRANCFMARKNLMEMSAPFLTPHAWAAKRDSHNAPHCEIFYDWEEHFESDVFPGKKCSGNDTVSNSQTSENVSRVKYSESIIYKYFRITLLRINSIKLLFKSNKQKSLSSR